MGAILRTPADRPETAAALDAAGLGTYPALLACERGERVTASSTSETRRLEVAGRPAYLKRYVYRRVRPRFLVLPSRAEREAASLDTLRRLGAGAPRWLAVGRDRRLRVVRSCVLLTEEAPGRPLADTDPDDPAERRALLEALARETARLHQAGWADGDLYARNILVEPAAPDGPRFHHIDSPVGRRLPGWLCALVPGLARRRFARDLGCLDLEGRRRLGERERLRFFARYRRARGLGRRAARALLAATVRASAREQRVFDERRARRARRRTAAEAS